VVEALDALPEEYRKKLDNVAVVVADWPDRQAMAAAGATHPAGVLGLYQGVPLERRTHNYTLVIPDKITLYQRPIELRSRTDSEVRSLISHVVSAITLASTTGGCVRSAPTNPTRSPIGARCPILVSQKDSIPVAPAGRRGCPHTRRGWP